MTIEDFYRGEKERLLDECTQCGLCAQNCPIIPHTPISQEDPARIQSAVYDFLKNGTPDPLAYAKAFACMECFKCTVDMCPQGLNPMLINHLVKAEYIERGLANRAFADPGAPESAQRVLASIQVSAPEYRRLITPWGKEKAGVVFFPGCNVYFQPHMLLNALDIMETLGDDFAFLPGLEHCCGEDQSFCGLVDEGGARAKELVTALGEYGPRTVILWCPTCLCRFEQILRPALGFSFEVVSFAQYLAANMGRLALSGAAAGSVTLHEACKAAYTGLDLNGPRQVLAQLPGVELQEMERCGRNTACCGSGAISWFPEACTLVRTERLDEAARTGAKSMVTVCHYCHQVFAAEKGFPGLEVTNYVDLVAQALGIERENRFEKYMRLGDPKGIAREAAREIAESLFSQERIREVLGAVFKAG